MMSEHSSGRWLVVKASSRAGLGDRVRAIVSAIAYARWSKRTLYVDWTGIHGRDARNTFSDLFRLEGVTATTVRPTTESIRPPVWKHRLHLNMDQLFEELGDPPWNYAWAVQEFSFDQSKQDWDEQVCVMFDFVQFAGLVPHLPELYSSITGREPIEWIQGEILHRHLRPSDAIHAELSSTQARLDSLRPYVGVHVRASEEHFRARPAPPVAAYVRAARKVMHKHGARAIFLATDNRSVQKQFADEFGADHVFWNRKWLPEPGGAIHLDNTCPDRLQAERDALLDVLILADADFLVTFRDSSFSTLARLFSDISRERHVILAPTVPLMRRVLNHVRHGCASFTGGAWSAGTRTCQNP